VRGVGIPTLHQAILLDTPALASKLPAVMQSKPAALAILLALAIGCTAETGQELTNSPAAAGSLADSLDLGAPEHGFQVETLGASVEPGDDVRLCEVVALPGSSDDTFYVGRIESALAAQGDDLVVSVAEPGSQTEAIMDVGASVPCTRAGEAFGEELSSVLSTQESYEDVRLPTGVGKVLRGGQKLAIETHFVNETNEPVIAKAKVSFHVVDAQSVQHIARAASFENFTIYTPPGGRSSHLGECGVHEEMLVSALQRRTQRFATDFTVWRRGGERDGELVWASRDGNDRRYEPTEPLHLLPGEGLRFQCDYHNTADRELRYGVGAEDETCVLNATFWSVDSLADTQHEGCLLFQTDSDGISRDR
jgi:hypothetical protein